VNYLYSVLTFLIPWHDLTVGATVRTCKF